MYNPPLVPHDFDLPQVLETDRMRIRPLTANDARKDYDAVISSSERLREVYNPGGRWPLGLTLEQNTLELSWHQVELQLRTSFAYTVVSLDETEVMDCVCIYPVRKPGYDAQITGRGRSGSISAVDSGSIPQAMRWRKRFITR